MKIRKIAGGFTAAKGFKAASCEAAIKYQNRRDMALLFTDVPCAVAGTFTSNRVKAAPVLWDMGIVKSGKPARAVVVNTGIANAGTGEEGMRLCSETAKHTAEILGISTDEVLVGSTGVIGPNVPLDRITAGVTAMAKNLSDSAEAGTLASKAIMTTDTVNKEYAVEFDLPAASGPPWRYEQGVRHDSSKHVHHAGLSGHRLRHRSFPAAESTQQCDQGHFQHDHRGRRHQHQ